MTAQKRQQILVAIMVLMLAIAAIWNFNWMSQQRLAALYDRSNMLECRRLADGIESLQNAPKLALARDMGIRELGKLIEQASQKASLSTSSLDGVFPQSPRRVGDTPYLIKPTNLVLRDVSLLQLAEFLYYIIGGSGLSVEELRLRVPHGRADSSQWDAEVTLTYLIYSPSADRRRQS